MNRTSVFLFLTKSCNLACRHCYVSARPGAGESMSFDTFESTVTQFTACGVTDFRLTGGEPTVHPSFLRMLDFMESIHVRPRLVTNGLRLIRMRDVEVILRRLTLPCHLLSGGFRTKLTIRLNNLRLPSKYKIATTSRSHARTWGNVGYGPVDERARSIWRNVNAIAVRTV